MFRKPEDYNTNKLYYETKILDTTKMHISKLMKFILRRRPLRCQEKAPDKRTYYKYLVITKKSKIALAETCQRYIGPRIINLLPPEIREKIFHYVSLSL